MNLKLVFSLLDPELLKLELPDLCPVVPELSEPRLVEPELPGFGVAVLELLGLCAVGL